MQILKFGSDFAWFQPNDKYFSYLGRQKLSLSLTN
jgi:hypothetical protein